MDELRGERVRARLRGGRVWETRGAPATVDPCLAHLRAGDIRRGGFDAAAQRIGVKDLHPHALRHTAASLAIASGANVKVVQQMLGHKSATMTLDLYGHLFPDQLDEVADSLDAAARAADVAPMCPQGEVVPISAAVRQSISA